MATIAIKDIIIPPKQLHLIDMKVEKLAQSIEQIGLQSPIKVRRDEQGRMALVFGWKRLNAHLHLGREEIEYTLFEGNEHEAELAHVDENLIRTELDRDERIVFIDRRRQAVEALAKWNAGRPKKPTPELSFTESGDVSRKLVSNDTNFKGNDTNDLQNEPAKTRQDFIDETAGITGKSTETVKRDLRLMAKLTPDARQVAEDYDLAPSDVVALAKLSAKQQGKVAQSVRDGVAVDEAIGAAREFKKFGKSSTPSKPRAPATISLITLKNQWEAAFRAVRTAWEETSKGKGTPAEWQNIADSINSIVELTDKAGEFVYERSLADSSETETAEDWGEIEDADESESEPDANTDGFDFGDAPRPNPYEYGD